MKVYIYERNGDIKSVLIYVQGWIFTLYDRSHYDTILLCSRRALVSNPYQNTFSYERGWDFFLENKNTACSHAKFGVLIQQRIINLNGYGPIYKISSMN